jgi:hypothetical protein
MTPTPMEIADFVAKRAASGSDFYQSMQQRIEYWGQLTERQLACVLKDMEPAAAARAPRASFDMTVIHAMFGRAAAALKNPAYRAAGLVLTRAKDSSANPGCIYVKDNETGAYLGKAMPGGEFRPVRECTPAHLEALREIEAAPGEAAVKWGKMTGRCSCCGRTLSDPVSIERGIGPICAETWGI